MRARLAGLAALALAACEPRMPPPQPVAVEPREIPFGEEAALVIYGRDFLPTVRVDYGDSWQSSLAGTFSAWLGPHALLDVTWVSARELHARAPGGMLPGLYPLVVQAPSREQASLEDALRVLGRPPAGIVFATPPAPVPAGACSPEVHLELIDASGWPASAPAALPVALSSVPESLEFYSDAACQTPLGALSFAPGTGSAALHFAGRVAGAVELRVDVASVGSVAQAEQILPGAAVALAWDPISSPQTIDVAFPVRAVARDAFGNAAGAEGPAALSSSGGAALLCVAGCDASGNALLVSGEFVGQVAVGARASGVSLRLAQGALLSESNAFDVLEPPPRSLAFASAPQVVTAGTCSQVAVVELHDASDRVVPARVATDVSMALTPPDALDLYADAACSSPLGPVQIPAGATQARLYFSSRVARTVHVAVSAAELASATQPERIDPAPTSAFQFAPVPSPRATGVGFSVSAVAQDQYGNATGYSGTAALAAVPSLALRCTDGCGPGGVAVFSGGAFSGIVAVDQPALGARLRLSVAGGSSDSNPFDVEDPPLALPVALRFATPPRSAMAGTCSDPLLVELRDALGRTVKAPVAASVDLAADPSAFVAFYSDPSCTTPLVAPEIARGETQLAFYLSGQAAGLATITASALGLAPDAQLATIDPGPLAFLAWDPIPSPQRRGRDIPVTVRGTDAFGNPAELAGAAALSISSGVQLLCSQSCAGATTTQAFQSSAWSGAVRVGIPTGTSRVLGASAGGIAGSSNAFDVWDQSHTPPRARLARQPVVVHVGELVDFDGAASTDPESSSGDLQASWDFEGSAQAPPPWTPWSAAKSASHAYAAPGLYRARLAVRDGDGDIGYAAADVLVVAADVAPCVVTDPAGGDRGASTCAGPGLSLPEAIRISNQLAGKQVITFAPGLTASLDAVLRVTDDVDVIGSPGVTIAGAQLELLSGRVLLSSLVFEGGASAGGFGRLQGGALELSDVTIRDFGTLEVKGGALVVDSSRFEACRSACLTVAPGASDVLIRRSRFSARGVNGIDFQDCAGGVRQIVGSVFTGGLDKGLHVKPGCGTGAIFAVNDTFDGIGVAAAYDAGAGHTLANSIFSNLAGRPLSGCGARFADRSHNLVWNSGDDGCTRSDPEVLVAVPQYVDAASGDLRLSHDSPARDTGFDFGVDLTPWAAGSFLGLAPDRGGSETW